MKKLLLSVILLTGYLIAKTDINKPVMVTAGEMATVREYVTNLEGINYDLTVECTRLRAEFENARVVLEEEVKKQNLRRARMIGLGIGIGATADTVLDVVLIVVLYPSIRSLMGQESVASFNALCSCAT